MQIGIQNQIRCDGLQMCLGASLSFLVGAKMLIVTLMCVCVCDRRQAIRKGGPRRPQLFMRDNVLPHQDNSSDLACSLCPVGVRHATRDDIVFATNNASLEAI